MSDKRPTFGDPDTWAYRARNESAPEHVSVVCGWCDGPVGSKGQCERNCETRRVVDDMTPDEIVEMIRRDADGDLEIQ